MQLVAATGFGPFDSDMLSAQSTSIAVRAQVMFQWYIGSAFDQAVISALPGQWSAVVIKAEDWSVAARQVELVRSKLEDIPIVLLCNDRQKDEYLVVVKENEGVVIVPHNKLIDWEKAIEEIQEIT